jgi:hypothetical protein
MTASCQGRDPAQRPSVSVVLTHTWYLRGRWAVTSAPRDGVVGWRRVEPGEDCLFGPCSSGRHRWHADEPVAVLRFNGNGSHRAMRRRRERTDKRAVPRLSWFIYLQKYVITERLIDEVCPTNPNGSAAPAVGGAAGTSWLDYVLKLLIALQPPTRRTCPTAASSWPARRLPHRHLPFPRARGPATQPRPHPRHPQCTKERYW